MYISTWSQHEIRFDPIYFYSKYTSLHPKNLKDKKWNIFETYSEVYVIPMKEKKIFVIFHQKVLTKTSYFSFGLVKVKSMLKDKKYR